MNLSTGTEKGTCALQPTVVSGLPAPLTYLSPSAAVCAVPGKQDLMGFSPSVWDMVTQLDRMCNKGQDGSLTRQ